MIIRVQERITNQWRTVATFKSLQSVIVFLLSESATSPYSAYRINMRISPWHQAVAWLFD